MNTKVYLPGIVALLSVAAVHAQDVSVQQALENASQFACRSHKVAGTSKGNELVLAYAPTICENGNSEYYVFNSTGDNGFVIVSGSSKTASAVLGYSDSGHFDYVTAPEGLKAMLEQYAQEVKGLESGIIATSSPKRVSGDYVVRPSVAPLLGETKWGQYAPFNKLVPNDDVTGCVATAMSQVMYYYKWPKQGVDANKNPIIFDWDNMLPSYSAGYTDEQANAVAKLMYDTGLSVEMEYGAGTSIARTALIAPALTEYFKYDNGAQRVMRDSYNYYDWHDLLYYELKEGRPVIMEGIRAGGAGHCFVLDGYSKDDYYHINWGWAGAANGYFLLTALAPSTTNDETIGFGYSSGVGATIGIKPKTDETPAYTEPQLHADQIKVDVDDVFGNAFTVNVIGVTNQSGFEGAWTFAVDVLDQNYNLVSTVFSQDFRYAPDPYSVEDFSYTEDSLVLNDGTYYVRPKFRLSGETMWRDINHKFTQEQYPKLIKTNGSFYSDNGYHSSDLSIEFTELDSIRYCGKLMSFKATVKNKGEEYYGPVQVYTYSPIWKRYYTCSEVFVVDLCKGDSVEIGGTIYLPAVSASIYQQRLVAIGSQQATGSFMLDGSKDFLIFRPSDEAPVLSISKELTPVSETLPADNIRATATIKNDGGYSEVVMQVLILPIDKMTVVNFFYQTIRIMPHSETTVEFSGNYIDAEYGKQYRMVLRDPNNTSIIKPWGNLQTFKIGEPGNMVIINGDLNGDGIIDVSDLNILIDIILGYDDEDNTIDPDINSDGNVDVEDANYMLNFILGQY